MEKPWYSFLYIKSPITKILWGILSVIVTFAAVLFVFLAEERRMEAQTGNWDGRSIEKGAEIYANNCYTCHGDHGQGVPGPALNSKHFFTERLNELGFTGTLEDYVRLTVAAGRPSVTHSQWGVLMPTWSNRFGGPLRDDQVQQVTDFVMNWESTAILQTPEEDPFIPFSNIPVAAAEGVTGTETVSGTTEVAPAEPAGPRSPQVLFGAPVPQGLGCTACHNVDVADTTVKVGPNLGDLPNVAGTRVPGEDAVTYVHNSILTPDAHVVEPFPPGIMPKDFGTRMTQEELDGLVTWLLDPNKTIE